MADIRLAGIASLEILNRLPEGVAVLSPSKMIVWSNQCFNRWFGGVDRVGQDFYSALGHPEVQGSGKCPVQSCIEHHQYISATLKREPNETSAKPAYYQLHAVCIGQAELVVAEQALGESSSGDSGDLSRIVVTVRDITDEVLQEQKLAAIHQAGAKLTDLKPDEIFAMDVEQRIDLLKENIRHYTQDLLNI